MPLAAIGAIAGAAIGGGALTAGGFALGAGALTGAAAGASLGGMFDSSGDLQDASAAQMQGIAAADQSMANAQVEASRLLAEGQAAQAAAIIEGAKISAQATLEAAGLAVEAQERFFAIADQKLEPFRQQGLEAGYEMASMLGIPNSKGELVPYDLDKLRSIPEFQFVFDEGQRAVEKSAAGTKLSGSQIKAQTAFGQGLAEQTFQKQFNNLSSVYNTGANAAGQLANAATNTGANIGQTYSNQGAQLSSIYGDQSSALADIYGANAIAQASLVESLGTNQANLSLAAAQNRASLYTNQANNRNSTLTGLLGLAGTLYGSKSFGGGTTNTTNLSGRYPARV